MSFDLSDVVIYNEEPSLLTSEQLKTKYVILMTFYSSIELVWWTSSTSTCLLYLKSDF